MVTEYAEGELFQVLEDDGSLPEQQVRLIGKLFFLLYLRWLMYVKNDRLKKLYQNTFWNPGGDYLQGLFPVIK